MSVPKRIRSAVPALRERAFLPVTAGMLVALLQGCSAMSASPWSGPGPSDPSVPVPPANHRSAIAGYASQRPVEPRPWREQNERVAPAPKQ